MNRQMVATLIGAVLGATVLADAALGSEDWDNLEPRGELMRALQDTKVSLEEGIRAAANHGTPISARYKFDQGELQLLIVTTGGDDDFWEVGIDQRMGTVRRVGPLSGRDDRAAAPGQRQAMLKATRSLGTAITEIVRAEGVYRAVSARPNLKEGRPAVTVILFGGAGWKTISVDLE